MRQAKGVPPPSAERYRMREIEKRLTQELQAASERVSLLAGNSEEKGAVVRAYEESLRRFAEFAAKGIVPDDLKDIKL